MIGTNFKKSVIFSLLGHLTIFSVFGVSFGRRLPIVNYGNVIFQGCVLNNFDLNLSLLEGRRFTGSSKKDLGILADKLSVEDLRGQTKSDIFPGAGYTKPIALLPFISEKQAFVHKFAPAARNKERTAVMFYPRLPPYFGLYFKDRQVVHMELMFKVTPRLQNSSISIKRKISSGNLEADLLCMRYINHYLFVQQGIFASGDWQTVKIELSAKNDD
jgi:hypothetical protein